MAFADWEPAGSTAFAEEFEARFPSPVSTPFPENNVVHVRAVMPQRRAGPVPVVLILHYWGATDQRVDRNLALELTRHGVAGLLVQLPYHLRRAPSGTRSGALAIQPDPSRLVETMAQSVLDVRRALDWVASRPEFDSSRVGIAGTSLGALVAALAVGVEPRIELAAFVLGGADLAHILWNSSRVVAEREKLRASGYTEDRLRTALAAIEPLRYISKNALRSAFVVGARHDTVIPPMDTLKLIHALGEPNVLWLDSGHYGGFLVQKRVQREVAKFFGYEMAGRDYQPPGRVSAPILRIGAQANPSTSVQVTVGLDVWRANARGEGFATLLATPNGFQLFVGVDAGRGLSVGASALQTGKVAVGVLWSLVL